MRLIRVLPVAFVLAAIACHALLAHAPARLATDLAQPLTVVTAWRAFGGWLWCALALPLLGAWCAYAYALYSRASGVTIAEILLLAAASIACAWAVPVLFSSDVYAYAAYGELARAGADPYVLGSWRAVAHPDDILRAAAWQWGNALPVCVYGPAFVRVAETVSRALHGMGAQAQLNALRAISSAALLACGAFAYGAYGGTREQRATAAATIALNPVAIWCAVEGHNDALALAVVLLGFWSARRVPAAGAAIVACAALIKAPAALAALAFATVARRTPVWIGTALALGAAALLSMPLFSGLRSGLAPHGTYAPQASLQAFLLQACAPFGSAAAPVAVTLSAVVLLAVAAYGVRLLHRGERSGYGVLALAIWLAVPNPYPWYALWLLPVAALLPRTRIALVLLGLGAGALLRYLPDASGPLATAPALLLAAASLLPVAAWKLRSQPVSGIISASP